MLHLSQTPPEHVMRIDAGSIVAGLFWLAATAAFAQTTPSHAPPNTANVKRIEGTVARLDGDELLLRVKGGTTETYQLAPAAKLIVARPGMMSDLSAGKFVRCTSIYSQGAKVLAGECEILKDSTLQIAESHDVPAHPGTPDYSGTITNVQDDGAADKGKDHHILVRIADPKGQTTMTVSGLTKISLIKAGDASALKLGASVHGISQQAADGTGVIQVLTIMSRNDRRASPSHE
jgi:hypothetical protein